MAAITSTSTPNSLSTSVLSRGLADWVALLGEENVEKASSALASLSRATFVTASRALGVLRPADVYEVQECLRIANRHQIPLYPVSSGKNWGYGSSVPVCDGVVLDLRRMNRILDFDEDLGFVTIEPGVTQGQLHQFLLDRKSKLWMDATGASPDCSIIGNTLERGFGHTPMGDHAGNSGAYQVVLPSGDLIETGFARFAGARAGALSHAGLGPSLDGLFSQSNFGVVTRMSVWLMPAPPYFEAFFFACEREDQLGDIIEALRPLRLDGTLRSVIHIGNDYKVLAGSTQYPWHLQQGEVPLRPETMAHLRQQFGIGAWNGGGGLYGSKAQVKAARSAVRRALKGKVKRLQFVNDGMVALLSRFGGPLKAVTGWDLRKTLKVLRPVYGLMKGEPTRSPLESTYWRKRTPVPPDMDPDRDGCGLLWCSPVFPCVRGDAEIVTRTVRDTFLKFGFEPQMSVSLESGRTAVCVATISYDRDVPGEDSRAMACYEAAVSSLMARGYPPYRLNVGSMKFASTAGPYDQLLSALKLVIDPNQIVAPGRYSAGKIPT